MDLAPDAAFDTAMPAGVPLAFTLDLDPGAVDQQVQRPLQATMRDAHGEGLPATAGRAEIRQIPVQAKQALNEISRLPRRQCRSDQWRNNGSLYAGRFRVLQADVFGLPVHNSYHAGFA